MIWRSLKIQKIYFLTLVCLALSTNYSPLHGQGSELADVEYRSTEDLKASDFDLAEVVYHICGVTGGTVVLYLIANIWYGETL